MDNIYREIAKCLTWQKGHPVIGLDPRFWRTDDFGNLLHYDSYGQRGSRYGWEQDHRFPSVFGGLSTVDNLRPMHWRPNASMGGILGSLAIDR